MHLKLIVRKHPSRLVKYIHDAIEYKGFNGDKIIAIFLPIYF